MARGSCIQNPRRRSWPFEAPDLHSFPCLALALRALRGGSDCCVALNAANEVAVEAFLSGRIGFMDIPALIEAALNDGERTVETGADSVVPDFLRQRPRAQEAFARLARIRALDSAVREETWQRIARM